MKRNSTNDWATYYHISNMRYKGLSLDEGWRDRNERKYFCEGCGGRLSGTRAINIVLTSALIPKRHCLGMCGAWDVGYVREDLFEALDFRASRYFYLGRVRGTHGAIPGWRTFVSKFNRVPIRGRALLRNERCEVCGRIRFAAMPSKRRYVVAREALTLPVYESNESQLVLRSDQFEKVKPVLTKEVEVEKLTFETDSFDGRAEDDLEWHGDGARKGSRLR